jgi:NAD+ synthase (glutamine-hydrolysing)
MKDGFIPVACGTPKLRLADCDYNAEQTFTLMRQAERAGAKVLVLPELGLTGYTCGDLFYQDTLLRGAEQALLTVLEATRNLEVVTAVGLPVQVNNRLYNCAAIIQRGRILGLVPKTHIPNYGEFYEKRQFAPAPEQGGPDTEWLCGDYVSFGAGQLFRCQEIPELVLGFEICEDLWTPGSPSVAMAQAGATVIGNLSASNEVLGKDAYRRQLVTMQSAKLLCGYLYASAGEGESTSDLVFGAHQMIAENGTLLAEQRYEGGLLLSEIDVQRLAYERRRTQILDNRGSGAVQADFSLTVSPAKLTRYVAPQPFVPEGREDRDERCREILLIASLGLKHRLEHTGAKTAVVGLSGGLDSTLAVLITGLAMKMLNRPMTDIIAVTMPCFGTTERTKSNAVRLCAALGVTLRDIPIGRSVEQHFRDIGHDPQDQGRDLRKLPGPGAHPGHNGHRQPGPAAWSSAPAISELALGWAPTTATTCPCTASTPPCRKRWCAISWPRGGQGGAPGSQDVLRTSWPPPYRRSCCPPTKTAPSARRPRTWWGPTSSTTSSSTIFCASASPPPRFTGWQNTPSGRVRPDE